MKPIEIRYKESALVEENLLVETIRLTDGYREQLSAVVSDGGYDAEEASLNLCSDESIRKSVEDLVKQKKTDALKYVFVIGIGGSNLGTFAVYNALRGAYDELLSDSAPKLVFIDTVSTALMETVRKIIDQDIKSADEVIINVISKSGTTTETIALLESVYFLLKKKFEDIDRRIVATTDHGSQLHQAAEEKGFSLLFLPKKVGGRYSVFSAVGLFPLALAGVNIQALAEGACAMRERCLSDDIDANPARVSAALQYHYYAQNIRINNNFFFNPELEMVGKWYRQLMGESVGKRQDVDGNIVYAGITPIVSIGSTDLHSMAQLYFGGSRDKFTCLVYAAPEHKIIVSSDRLFPDLVKNISGKSLEEIMTAIYGGVKAAYKNNALPFMEVVLPEINEHAIGQYLQFKMMEMMYLANLMHVNAFDQPNVEDYKEETRKLL